MNLKSFKQLFYNFYIDISLIRLFSYKYIPMTWDIYKNESIDKTKVQFRSDALKELNIKEIYHI